MAIGIHVAQFKNKTVGSSTSRRIADDGELATTAGDPTLKDFLVAEAANNYLLHYKDDQTVVTVNVADLNAAGS